MVLAIECSDFHWPVLQAHWPSILVFLGYRARPRAILLLHSFPALYAPTSNILDILGYPGIVVIHSPFQGIPVTMQFFLSELLEYLEILELCMQQSEHSEHSIAMCQSPCIYTQSHSIYVTMYVEILDSVYVLMSDEKEGRKKQARSNKQQGKATQQTQGSHFS